MTKVICAFIEPRRSTYGVIFLGLYLKQCFLCLYVVTIWCKLNILAQCSVTGAHLSHMLWLEVKAGSGVNTWGLKEKDKCCICTPILIPKLLRVTFISPMDKSSPSNAALLSLLNCLLMSMCLDLCTHHIEATSFTCPAGHKSPAQPWYTHTGAVTLLLCTVWASADHVWLTCPRLYCSLLSRQNVLPPTCNEL